MKRHNARRVVYGTLKNLGVDINELTSKARLGQVLDGDVRIGFIQELKEKLPGSRTLNPSQISILTVGQVIRVLSSEMPGDDSTKGRRHR